MDKARLGGMLICIVAVALLVLFYVGLSGSMWKWAVGIPVAAGVTVVMLLGLWIGWTMFSTKVELPPAEEDEETTDTTTAE